MKIEHKSTANRGMFYIEEDGSHITRLTYYKESEDVWVFDHTFTLPSRRKEGLARKIVLHATEYVRNLGKEIIPACWYVAQVFEEEARKAKN